MFIASLIPQTANAQSTSSGDVLPGRGIMVIDHQAVIDSGIVMLAQRAQDSITSIKVSIAAKTTLAAALLALSITASGTGTPSYNNTTGVINIPAINVPIPYTGTTNGSGNYTVTFGSAYTNVPVISATFIGATTNQYLRIVSVSTTGFTVNAYGFVTNNILGIINLTSATTNISGASIQVLITPN